MAEQPRILITRLGHIGDCVLTLPIANALRERFPQAFIAWVVERPSQQLLVGQAAIDQVIELRRGWLKSPRQVAQVRRDLRRLRFDLAIDPQSLTKSALLAWLSGAKRRIGFARPLGRELAPLLDRERITPTKTHLVDRSLELLRPLGIDSPAVKFELSRPDASQQAIERFIRDSHLGCGFALLNPGAGWGSRRWPPVRFGKVAKHLGQAYKLPSVVVWAGDEERRMAETIIAASGGNAIAAPATGLCDLAELCRRSRFLFSGDTGPLHIAAAVGTPCIGLHGVTRWQDSGAYGRGHIHLQKQFQSGTSRERRQATNAAVELISVEDACAACDQMWEQIAGNARRVA